MTTRIHIPPPDDDYPRVIGEAIRALVAEGHAAGAAVLERIAYPPRDVAKRPGLPRAVVAAVLRDDNFLCRYCGGELIPTSIMELLGSVYPGLFPYHPNWKGGQTHPAIPARSPVVDHVVPGSREGSWLDRENLVTACWPCNVRKADFTLEQLGWELRPRGETAWEGLTDLYWPLWRAAGRPRPNVHLEWMRSFGVDIPDDGHRPEREPAE